jgi:hypothetical protein
VTGFPLLARGALVALLAVWTVRFATHPLNVEVIGDSFLHLVNLPFHEAGHIFFSPFGSFMMSLGGSLMQVLVPVVCVVAFVRKPDLFGAAVAVWWAGQNLVDLGPYIADARALQVPLLGGATGAEVEGHDWEAILQTLGWLHRDRQIAMFAHVLGSLTMAAGVIGAAGVAWTDHRNSTSHTLPRTTPYS